jgi:hypothetical protein
MRLSPHDPGTFYYGAQYLFCTRDEGATWETISPDLTRQIEIDPGTYEARLTVGSEVYSAPVVVRPDPSVDGG